MKSYPAQTTSRLKKDMQRKVILEQISFRQRRTTTWPACHKMIVAPWRLSKWESTRNNMATGRCQTPNSVMPNNFPLAVNHLNSLLNTFRKKPRMKEEYFQFMGKILERGHAVPVPPEELSEEQMNHPITSACNTHAAPDRGKARRSCNNGRVWYPLHFGVYHPRKPDQIPVVLNSAEFLGVSLNKELLPGPDLMNSLGVLIRFFKETVAIMCDIEQMFHTFHMNPHDQNFL